MQKKNKKELQKLLQKNLPNKFLIIAECVRRKIDQKVISDMSNYDPWFVREISEIIEFEFVLEKNKISKRFIYELRSLDFLMKNFANLKLLY